MKGMIFSRVTRKPLIAPATAPTARPARMPAIAPLLEA